MDIILWELKKIWKSRAVIVMVIFFVLYFVPFMLVDKIVWYPLHETNAMLIEMRTEITRRYGETVSLDEFQEYIIGKRDELAVLEQTESVVFALGHLDWWHEILVGYHLAAEFINEHGDVFEPSQVTEFAQAKRRELASPELYEAINAYSFDFFFSADRIIWMYNHKLEWFEEDPNGFLEAFEVGEFTFLPLETLDNFIAYMRNLAQLTAFTTLILFLPLITSDKLRQMRLLQYSGAIGRRLLGKQFTAMLLSSIILTSLLVLICGGMFAINNTHVFWRSSVESFLNSFVPYFPITYGQYVLAMVGMVYLLGLGVTTIAFLLSRFCSNYIALAAGGIGVGVVVSRLCTRVVFDNPLMLWAAREWYDGRNYSPYEPLMCIGLLVVGLIVGTIVIRQERKLDTF